MGKRKIKSSSKNQEAIISIDDLGSKTSECQEAVSLQGTKDRQALGDRSVIQKRLEHSIPCSSESISNAFGKRSMMDNYTFNNHLKNIRKSISKIQRESFDYLDSLQFYNLLCKKSLDLENKKIKRFSRKNLFFTLSNKSSMMLQKTSINQVATLICPLTFENVRRLLEKDLGLETHDLDTHKRFITQWIYTVLFNLPFVNFLLGSD